MNEDTYLYEDKYQPPAPTLEQALVALVGLELNWLALPVCNYEDLRILRAFLEDATPVSAAVTSTDVANLAGYAGVRTRSFVAAAKKKEETRLVIFSKILMNTVDKKH